MSASDPQDLDPTSQALWMIKHIVIGLSVAVGLFFLINLIPGNGGAFDANVAAAQAGMSTPAEQGFIMICAGPIIRWIRADSPE